MHVYNCYLCLHIWSLLILSFAYPVRVHVRNHILDRGSCLATDARMIVKTMMTDRRDLCLSGGSELWCEPSVSHIQKVSFRQIWRKCRYEKKFIFHPSSVELEAKALLLNPRAPCTHFS
jgi:hypothetical protein